MENKKSILAMLQKRVIKLIDYIRTFELMNKEYENLVQEYYEFKANQTIETKEKLLKQIKIFNSIKNTFSLNVSNLYIGKKVYKTRYKQKGLAITNEM